MQRLEAEISQRFPELAAQIAISMISPICK